MLVISLGIGAKYLWHGLNGYVAPMVVGALVTLYLALDSLVRLRYVLPLKKEIRDLHNELVALRQKMNDV